MVDRSGGYLVIDDSVADKWYAKNIEMVQRQYSGNHHWLVDGFDVVSLLWTQSTDPSKAEHITVDFRLYAPTFDGKTKHNHATELLESSFLREFESPIVTFDSWYSATKTLKFINHDLKWTFVAAVVHNRHVHRSVDGTI